MTVSVLASYSKIPQNKIWNSIKGYNKGLFCKAYFMIFMNTKDLKKPLNILFSWNNGSTMYVSSSLAIQQIKNRNKQKGKR